MWKFRVAEAVPLEGTITYEDLTAKVNELDSELRIPVLNLRRLIRHAMTNRIFCEPTKGHVAHTRASRLLLEDAPLNNWVGFLGSDLFIPIASTVTAMKKWPGSEEPNETSVNLAYNQDLKWYDWMQKDPVFLKRYNLAMTAHGGAESFSLDGVTGGYEWGDLPEGATVVDVSLLSTLCSPLLYGLC
jgi:hypothetical protein